MTHITVYTDGSCLGNPGPGGWAFLLVEDHNGQSAKVVFEHSGYYPDTTNNRMEMTAFLEALKYLAKNFSSHQCQIFSDSNLLVQTINQGWKRKANQDIWNEIDQYISKLKIQITWVKAHAKNAFNNRCDELAQSAARSVTKSSSPALQKKNKSPLPSPSPSSKKPAGNPSRQASLF